MKKLYLIAFVSILLLSQAFAQETETETAALSVLVNGQVNCGSVSPDGRLIVYTGEKISISALPKTGYSFSGWMLSGDGEISSEVSASPTVTLDGNTLLKACFYKNDGSMKAVVNITSSSDNYGTVSPSGISKIDAGRIFDISALPNNGYKFIKWRISGTGEIKNILSPDTRAVVYGDTDITAIFASENDVYDVIVYAAGENSVPENISVLKGKTVNLKAIHTPKTFFLKWSSNNGGHFSNPRSIKTLFTPENSCTVTAERATAICNFSNKSRKIKLKVKCKPEKNTPPIGDLTLKMLPMCLGPDDFNPNTDAISVSINGTSYIINNTTGIFKRTPVGYKYKSNDNPKIKLTLDFISAVWSFSIKKTDLKYLDVSAGCDTILEVNGSNYGHKYIADEKLSLSFIASRNQSEIVSTYPLLPPTRLSIKKDTGKNNRDSLKIVMNQIPLLYTFNPAVDYITISLGEYIISIPPGMMIEKNGSFSYKDKQLSIKFDPNKQSLSLVQKKMNIHYFGFDGKLKMILQIGKNKTAANLTPAFSQKIQFKYDSFYWNNKKSFNLP
jgi:hypothetical protein